MAIIDTSTNAPIAPLVLRSPAPREGRAPSTQPSFDADVAIVGLGYVGLPTALAYHAAGSRVIGIDVSPQRLEAIRTGDVDLITRDHDRLGVALGDEGFEVSGDPAALSRAAAVIVCVPTPVDAHLVPDLTMVRGACAAVVEHAVPGQLLMLTSTTYVGCTEDVLLDPVVRRGMVPGQDIFIAFSAERIDPGQESVSQESVPRVVGGATPECVERAAAVLSRYATDVHRVPSLGTAEMTKLLENTFRAVNIALVNEFADICRTLDIAVTDVIDAAATKPYGYMAFSPGAGVGGHCIPCDPHYLLWQLRKDRVEAPMINEAMQQISRRPGHVVERVRELLSDRGRSLAGSRILVVGVAYKPDVADLRESPALEIMQRLLTLGASVGYVDPHVRSLRLEGGVELQPVKSPGSFHPTLVLLHTKHHDDSLDWLAPDQLVLDATYRSTGLTNRVAL
ncbi:MAG: UDP-glucose 6-dehydrogenase [Aeromicrobium sp.]|uniref:nucleotide sugar dehydrogenase n=1 Tax=Aeromicrobium sp. TaxID=1871063 RepID=UPI00261FF996|nr:nucleotide sugar dehydrogenase [Aeromicrobium sp.]MCW2824698.1 UDP-glucose 6-dehydrogenase [Aeromicrobium sp.]